MFEHVELDLPKLKREEIDGKRYYRLPDDDVTKLVSITTVTSFQSRKSIAKWRRKVGEAEANKISSRAASRGTDMHTLVEHYLKNEPIPEKQPLSEFLFKFAKPKLNNLNKIHALEKSLYSKRLGVAGTVDCIAEYNGELAIVDFKTSKEPKPREWIEKLLRTKNFVGYACMLYELTGISVKKLVIIMSCENGSALSMKSTTNKSIFDYLCSTSVTGKEFNE